MSGTLYIYDITAPASPMITGVLHGLGNVRQLEVKNGVAYVASREDGLFVIDVSDSASPDVVSRFDAVEFATGVDIYGIRAPKHIGLLKIGEAQSVDVSNGYLYAGIWGAKEMVVCDIRNPYNPRIVTRLPVDGRGDGICVKGNYCYAATGHHARGISRYDVSDLAFGLGNGMEIFDISDPDAPVFISRIKINRFIDMFYDMWDVTVSGNYAFLSHTYNGIFVIDVSNPKHPVISAHMSLPQIDGQMIHSPVGGIAIIDGYIYAAGILSDLHVIEAPEYVNRIEDDTKLCDNAGWAQKDTERSEIHVQPVYATHGFAMDIKKSGDTVYVAEGYGGLSIWRITDDTRLELLGRYVVDCYTVRQVVIPEQGKYAIIQVGSKWLHIVDIENPKAPELVYLDTQFKGQQFSRQLSSGLAEGRYVACIWHSYGFFWYDIFGGSRPKYAGYCCKNPFLAFNGIVCTPEHTLMTHDKGYVLPDLRDGGDLALLPHYGIEGFDLTGKPTVYGNTLFVSNRLNGLVTVLDISDITDPRLQTCFRLEDSPDLVAKHKNKVAISAGYQGLLVYTSYDPL